MNNIKFLGNCGEAAVANFLLKKDFKILAQNYTTRYGEIDLIAHKNELIVFVEVKTRKNEYFSTLDVITLGKQKKLTHTAKFFISQNNIIDKVCRFDVATVLEENGEYKIDYIENAFYAYQY